MSTIDKACEAFRILLEEQQARIANMNGEKVDFSKKDTIIVMIIITKFLYARSKILKFYFLKRMKIYCSQSILFLQYCGL